MACVNRTAWTTTLEWTAVVADARARRWLTSSHRCNFLLAFVAEQLQHGDDFVTRRLSVINPFDAGEAAEGEGEEKAGEGF